VLQSVSLPFGPGIGQGNAAGYARGRDLLGNRKLNQKFVGFFSLKFSRFMESLCIYGLVISLAILFANPFRLTGLQLGWATMFT
jgi:F-type H+-transporting ATPase subunit c